MQESKVMMLWKNFKMLQNRLIAESIQQKIEGVL